VPFSYLDEKQNAIGYSIDLCEKVVEAVKAELKMPDLKVRRIPVVSQTRIPLVANGTVDLECGSTTNTLTRQKAGRVPHVTFIGGDAPAGEGEVRHQGGRGPQGQVDLGVAGHDQRSA